jgi:hypothetical protein
MFVSTGNENRPRRLPASLWSIVRLLRRRTIKPRKDQCERWLFGREAIDLQVEAKAGTRRVSV